MATEINDMTTIIKARTKNQLLTITERPIIASGDVNTVVVYFEFDPAWSAFTVKFACFHKANQPHVVYKMLISDDGYATVPHEVLGDAGDIFFGVKGYIHDSPEIVKTSLNVKYSIQNGSDYSGGKTPTPDEFAQMMQEVGDIKQNVSEEMTAMNATLQEFAASEEERNTAESTRIAHESAREASERTRKDNEAARVKAEASRKERFAKMDDELREAIDNISDGKSAYEVAVDEGFNGTVDEWLASLKGNKGVGIVSITISEVTDEDDNTGGGSGNIGGDTGGESGDTGGGSDEITGGYTLVLHDFDKACWADMISGAFAQDAIITFADGRAETMRLPAVEESITYNNVTEVTFYANMDGLAIYGSGDFEHVTMTPYETMVVTLTQDSTISNIFK